MNEIITDVNTTADENPSQSSESEPMASVRDQFVDDDNGLMEAALFHEKSDRKRETDHRRSSTSAKNGTYPADCYSFMAIHGPLENPVFFFFGFLVWAFQIAFLILLVLRVASRQLSTNEDTDNPDDGFLSQFIPSNVGHLSRATQFMALLSYCIFADESLKDIVTAVETWPKLSKAKEGDKVNLIMLSCFLRFSQGMLATISVLLLVVTTSDVIEIILNFTAVNFISAFDDVAFELAQWGKYGPKLEDEANRIEELPVPDCIYRKYQHVRYRFTVIPMAFVLILLLGIMAFRQDSREVWLTQRMRVQFEDDSSLEPFSGCYDMTDYSRARFFGRKRVAYTGLELNPRMAQFGYCEKKRKWFMYTGNKTDACDILREEELAHSDISYAYDISSSFEASWYSPSGTPLELYFFEDESFLDDAMCSAFLGDGRCNTIFNTAEYEYDQGDCCAATCNEAHCGIGTVTTVYDTELTSIGDGYSECKSPDMKPITILLNDVFLPEEEVVFGGGRGPPIIQQLLTEEDKQPRNPMMIIDCDGKNILMTTISPEMKGKTETIMVTDGASCTMMVKNSTISITQVWFVDYTLYHGDEKSIEIDPIVMAEGNSFEQEIISFERIHECFFEKLDGLLNKRTIYLGEAPSHEAIEWLMNDPSGFSNCEDRFFVERYALAVVNFAAPVFSGTSTSFNEAIPDEDGRILWINYDRQCVWEPVGCVDGSVTEINFAAGGLKIGGTIASEIGLLSSLKSIDMNDHNLYGSIPSEIGQLSALKLISMNQNTLEGTIPTEIGLLKSLRLLDLHSNGLSSGYGIEGSLPAEFLQMSSLEVALLYFNAITGSIPNDIDSLSTLSALVLDVNKLTGTIPSSLGSMEKMEYVGMSYNFITGTIPREMGGLKAWSIMMDYNFLTGSVPLELLENKNIRDLGLYGNGLSDLLPIDGSVICVAPQRIPSTDDDVISNPSNNDFVTARPPDARPPDAPPPDAKRQGSQNMISSEVSDDHDYGTGGGEHYCDCEKDCFPADDSPNRCACEEAEACCENYMSQFTPCVICELGLANPEHYAEKIRLSCREAVAYVELNLREFGTKEKCDGAREMGRLDGCLCTEDIIDV